MRIVTDPFVDFFTLVLGRFVLPFFYKTSGFFLTNILGLITFFAGNLVPPSVVSSQSHDITSWVVRHTYIFSYCIFTSILSGLEGIRIVCCSIAVVAIATSRTSTPSYTEDK